MAKEIGAAFEYVESGGVEVYGEPSEGMLAMMRNIADVPVTVRAVHVAGITRLGTA